MSDYRIAREGRKLTVEILPSVQDFEAVEIIDGLQEEIMAYIDESLYGPIEEEDDFDGLDEFFEDQEEYDDPVPEEPYLGESYN